MRSQRGSVALIAIVFLLFLTIIGVSWLPLLNTEAQHAKMDSDEQMAWYAAEAGYKRAYAGLKNGDSGYLGIWGWLSENFDKPEKLNDLDNKKKIQYAVIVTNLQNTGGNITVPDGDHKITSIGIVNGIRRVIKETVTTSAGTGGGGDVADKVLKSGDIIPILLGAQGTTGDKNISSVVDYFSKRPNSKSLDSFGGTYAQYFGKTFWQALVDMAKSGQYTSLEMLKEVDNKNSAPRTLKVGTHWYDITPEHYLWRIYNMAQGQSVNNYTDLYVNVQWTYLGSTLDNVMAYKTGIDDTPVPKRPSSDFYYVTMDYAEYKRSFLPYSSHIGNPVASRMLLDKMYMPDVDKFLYQNGVLSSSGEGYGRGKVQVMIEDQTTFAQPILTGAFVGSVSDYTSALNDYPKDIVQILQLLNLNNNAGNNVTLLKNLDWTGDGIKKYLDIVAPGNSNNQTVADKFRAKLQV
ncbi:pilus assembly PilX family protein [Phascolarctobacterium sp.]